MAYRCVRIADVETVPALDGKLLWHPLRHVLGVTGFGVNAYTAPQPGDEVVEEHQEGDANGGDQELYVVISGAARFTIDGDEFDADAGTCVFLPDPATVRHAVAIEPATTVLAIGGEPGLPFEVSAWEWNFRANPHIAAGELERAEEIVRDGLDAHPGNGALLYNLACCEARLGRLDDAAGHLRDAVAAEERVREWAAGDSDLDALRGRPDFPA
jgi:tetratricopeptide (TPR) repeat protein